MVRDAARKLVVTEMVLNKRFGVSRYHSRRQKPMVTAALSPSRIRNCFFPSFWMATSPVFQDEGFRSQVTADQIAIGNVMPR